MPSAVLGKRTRSSAGLAETVSSVRTRSKRHAQFVVLDNDENENPFITRASSKCTPNGDVMEVDDHASSAKSSRRRGAVPAQLRASEPRSVLSPAKENKLAQPTAAIEEKPSQTATPTTPRHRDALAKKVAVTPRHRFTSAAGIPLTPRTPRTPHTPRTSAPTCYVEARQLFTRSSNPGKVIGRDNERKELQEFVSARVENKRSGCIYVSGPPGTGKSALVSEICRGLENEGSIQTAYINCMSIKDAKDVYVKLLEELVGDPESVEEGKEVHALKKVLSKRKTSYVVTLDEIDFLMDIDVELLYNLFEWSLRPSTSLILVGIANALDFTDRFLPRLKSKGLKPHLLPFLPYSAAQIASIITTKLKSLLPPSSEASADFVPFVNPTAITFLSKKVSSQTGDLRRAFDMVRRALDIIEAETRDAHYKKLIEQTPTPSPSPTKTPLIENINLSSPPRVSSPRKPTLTQTLSETLTRLTALTAPRVTIVHMSRITASIFNNGTTQRLANLNLQQKAVLCALAALEHKLRTTSSPADPCTPSKSSRGEAVTTPSVKQVYESYTQLCKRENLIHALSSTEFRDVVAGLETLSLVSEVEGKGAKIAGTPSRRGRGGFGKAVGEEKRISGSVGLAELKGSLHGPGCAILMGLLEGIGS